MIIEKWQDDPAGIDSLVKKKDSMDPTDWSQCLRDFYQSISSSNRLYKESHITVPIPIDDLVLEIEFRVDETEPLFVVKGLYVSRIPSPLLR